MTNHDGGTCKDKSCREAKKYLRQLIATVHDAVKFLDAEMAKPSTPQRGQRIATITNALEMSADLAKRFGLSTPIKKPQAGKEF